MNIFVKNHLELRLNKDGSIDEIIRRQTRKVLFPFRANGRALFLGKILDGDKIHDFCKKNKNRDEYIEM